MESIEITPTLNWCIHFQHELLRSSKFWASTIMTKSICMGARWRERRGHSRFKVRDWNWHWEVSWIESWITGRYTSVGDRKAKIKKERKKKSRKLRNRFIWNWSLRNQRLTVANRSLERDREREKKGGNHEARIFFTSFMDKSVNTISNILNRWASVGWSVLARNTEARELARICYTTRLFSAPIKCQVSCPVSSVQCRRLQAPMMICRECLA